MIPDSRYRLGSMELEGSLGARLLGIRLVGSAYPGGELMRARPRRRSRRARWNAAVPAAALLALMALLAPRGAEAQAWRTLEGGTVGLWWWGSDGIVHLALHRSSVSPAGAGYELSVATAPGALAHGAIVLAPEIGLTWAIPGEGFQLRPTIGPTALVGAGEGGFGGMLGAHAGAGLLVPTPSEMVFRLEGAVRTLAVSGGFTPAIFSMGMGFMWGEW